MSAANLPPDISIIIPARDRLWSLPKAVESCRSDRLRMQIIVVDDGSSDGTAEWLAAQSDITVVAGEGWGKPAGVNRATVLATGKYLRFLDSDDWLNAGANEGQFEVAERDGADIVVAGLDLYRGDDLDHTVPWIETDDFIAQQLGEAPGSHYSAFLFRRAFAQGIPHRGHFPAARFAARDDRCFILEAALRAPRISSYGKPALCHRVHDNPRLQFQGGLAGAGTNIQTRDAYRQILRLLEQRGELTARRRRAATKVLWPLAHWIAYSHLDEACEVAGWVYDLDPEFAPPERRLLGWLYRRLGFRATERILQFRRFFVCRRPLTQLAARG